MVGQVGATPVEPSVLDWGLLTQRLTLSLLAVVSAWYLPWNRAKGFSTLGLVLKEEEVGLWGAGQGNNGPGREC